MLNTNMRYLPGYFVRKIAVTGLTGILMIIPLFFQYSEPAHAASAKEFVYSLAGNWRGTGTVIINNAGRKTKVRCALKNILDEAGRKLTLSGRCASSSGSRKLKGALSYANDGNQISGAINSGVSKTQTVKSTASFDGQQLTLTSRTYDEKTNRTERTRSVIAKKDDLFTMGIQFYRGSAWEKRGTVIFKK